MQTINQKIENSVSLNKLLNYKKIVAINGKDFALQLQRALLYFEASENYKLTETKDEFKKLNIEFKDKYDYFLQCFGTKKTQTSVLIKIGSLDSQVIADYLKDNLRPSLDNLVEFTKKDSADMNTTTEAITEKTETEKPTKFTTEKKGIDIKINSGVTNEDIKQAIEYLQSLQK
jgi:hypothetical protein